jgi:hypothetical protein
MTNKAKSGNKLNKKVTNDIVNAVRVGECKACGKEFPKKNISKKFCNAQCRYKYWDYTHPRITALTTKH